MELAIKRTFAALEVRNFRLFIFGQGISLCGTWMQTIGLSWLVLKITHSGTELGLVVAAQFLPILFFGLWGGVIADRFHKRYVLLATQALLGILALTLGALVITNLIHLWMIYIIATGIGLINVVDNPTRQSFVVEMVGKKHLKNAISLNSTLVNMARVIGPSIAGILIAAASIGTCFIVNGLSYIAVLIALYLMHEEQLFTTISTKKVSGQIKAGLTYIWHEPRLKSTLIMMFIIGIFTYEFPVILPLFATITLHGNAGTYSAIMVATGIGAIFGGLYTAGRAERRESQLVLSAILFGVSILIASLMPSLPIALVVFVLVGVMSILFIALGNTTLQLASQPEMRGRVMSLWAIAFVGTTPIGGPIIGYISDRTNPRVGLAVGGISAIIAGVLGFYIYKSALREQLLD